MTTWLHPIPDEECMPGLLSVPATRYPNEYVWFVFFSAIDVMLTWIILHAGGCEVNPIAALVIETWELPGAIAFKFSLMVLVIVICENVGRHRDFLARRLAQFAVLISALPVLYSFGLMVSLTIAPIEVTS